MRVLIADDSAVDRIMLRRVVEGLGHDVLLASTGKEAWELYQAHGADVLLSDWMMPGLNGPELCRRIRSQPGAAYTYIILLTVLDDNEHTRHGTQAGADAVIDALQVAVDRANTGLKAALDELGPALSLARFRSQKE